MTAVIPWQKEFAPSRPPENRPPPPKADYGPAGPKPSLAVAAAAAPTAVTYYQPPPVPTAPPAPGPGGWVPSGALAPPRPAPRAATRSSWVQAHPPAILRRTGCGGYALTTGTGPDDEANWVNYDPPPEAGGTGLQQTNCDGSWVVHPLSVIHPGSTVGDEGPINEAFLSTPVVHLCAGRPYALSSPVVVPDGATLHLNRAAIDRDQIQVGEGAIVHD